MVLKLGSWVPGQKYMISRNLCQYGVETDESYILIHKSCSRNLCQYGVETIFWLKKKLIEYLVAIFASMVLKPIGSSFNWRNRYRRNLCQYGVETILQILLSFQDQSQKE